MNPNDWLKECEMNGAQLSSQLGVDAATVSRSLSAVQYPSFQLMWWMHTLSGGRISLQDWIEMFERKYRGGEALPPSRVPNPPIRKRSAKGAATSGKGEV